MIKAKATNLTVETHFDNFQKETLILLKLLVENKCFLGSSSNNFLKNICNTNLKLFEEFDKEIFEHAINLSVEIIKIQTKLETKIIILPEKSVSYA